MKNNSISTFSLNCYNQLELFFTSLPPQLLSLPLIFPSPLSFVTKEEQKKEQSIKIMEKIYLLFCWNIEMFKNKH